METSQRPTLLAGVLTNGNLVRKANKGIEMTKLGTKIELFSVPITSSSPTTVTPMQLPLAAFAGASGKQGEKFHLPLHFIKGLN